MAKRNPGNSKARAATPDLVQAEPMSEIVLRFRNRLSHDATGDSLVSKKTDPSIKVFRHCFLLVQAGLIVVRDPEKGIQHVFHFEDVEHVESTESIIERVDLVPTTH